MKSLVDNLCGAERAAAISPVGLYQLESAGATDTTALAFLTLPVPNQSARFGREGIRPAAKVQRVDKC